MDKYTFERDGQMDFYNIFLPRVNPSLKTSDLLSDSKAIYKEQLIKILRQNDFTKIHIDENCIVGWASSFYKTVPTARKEDFIGDDTGKHKTVGEIRNPVHFKKYILPYRGKSNVKFNYLMDRLNDTLQKKNLGAFYTHRLYAQKSLELVREAIARVPKGTTLDTTR